MADLTLNELDFENLGDWPSAYRIGAIILTCVSIAAIWGFLILKRQHGQLKIHERTEIVLRDEYRDKYYQAVHLAVLTKQLKEVKQKLSKLLSQLPTKNEVPMLLEDISRVGHLSGLKFSLFKPGTEERHDFYAQLPITIHVSGGYHQISKFISDISAFDRIVNLGDFDMKLLPPPRIPGQPQKKPDGTQLQMSLTAMTYRYLESGEKHG